MSDIATSWAPRRWTLERAEDPRFVADLVTYPDADQSRIVYFLPVLAAWGLLGAAEHLYEQSEPTTESFFTWWTQQALGPSKFSFALAVIVMALIVAEGLRTLGARRRRTKQAAYEAQCVAFSQSVTQALSHWQASKPDTTVDLVRANAALSASATGLSRIADTLSSGAPNSDAVAAVHVLAEALHSLDLQLTSLAEHSSAMAAAAQEVPEKIGGWTDDLRRLGELRETVLEHAASTREAGEQFADGSRQLLERLPMAEVALNRSHELTEIVLDAQRTAREFLETTAANQRDMSEAVEGQVAALARAAGAVTTAGQDLKEAAQDLRLAVVIHDKLKGSEA